MAPTTVPWSTVMRERHVAAPRAAAWTALLDHLGDDPGDLSVEAPWRHVRGHDVGGEALAQTTVAIREDGPESHLAWCAGTSLEGEEAEAWLASAAVDGEALLDDLVAAAE